MPKLARIPLGQIDEPQLPIRISMDSTKMDELCDSMKQIGLLQPIGVKVVDGRYEIEFGHRRYRAARLLKWKDIPALIFSKQELAEGASMIAENVEREDISAAEEAILFAQAQEKYSLDEEGLCKRFRRSASYIARRLSLLRGDPEVYRAVQERKISFGAALELNRCTDEPHRRYLLDAAIRSEAGYKVVIGWVAQWRAQAAAPSNSASPEPSPPAPQPDISHGIECRLCGGFRDPYNLVPIYIHKWELAKILEIMQRPADDEPESNPSAAAPPASV